MKQETMIITPAVRNSNASNNMAGLNSVAYRTLRAHPAQPYNDSLTVVSHTGQFGFLAVRGCRMQNQLDVGLFHPKYAQRTSAMSGVWPP
jgi:hypothetical protein